MIKGFSILAEGLKVIPGTVRTCCEIVESGQLLAVSPGGVYEALFGDQSYPVMWKSRVGFAKAAISAKVVMCYLICLIALFSKPFLLVLPWLQH